MKKKYIVNGQVYEIPDEEAGDFLKDFPNAKVSYTIKGQNYEIPHQEIDAFETDMGLKKKLGSSNGATTLVNGSSGTPKAESFADTLNPFKNVQPKEVSAPVAQKPILDVFNIDKTLNPQKEKAPIPEIRRPRTLTEAHDEDINFFGNTWNKFLEGAEGLAAGSASLASHILPPPPGMKREDFIKQISRDVVEPSRTATEELVGANVTPQEKANYENNLLTSTVGGLVRIIPAIGGKGAGLVLQAYDDGMQSINQSEVGKTLPENTKTIYSGLVGLTVGLMDRLALTKIFGKGSNEVASNVTAKVLNDLIKTSKVAITSEMAEAAVNAELKSLKNKIINGTLKVGKGSVIEGLTETGQEGITVLAENFLNKIENKPVFDEQNWKERITRAGIQGVIGGGLLGGISVPFDNSRRYIADKVANAQTEEDITGLKQELMETAAAKNLSPEETGQLEKVVDDYVRINQKIPAETPNRVVLVEKIKEREEVQQEIAAKEAQLTQVDEAFQPEIKKEIAALETKAKELNKEIVENEDTGTTGETNKPLPTNEGSATEQGTETTIPESTESVSGTTSATTDAVLESKFPKPERDISEMSADEIHEYSRTVKQYYKDQEVEFFGEEGAKKYRQARETSNSLFASKDAVEKADAILKEMEDSLTKEQSDAFFGVNEKEDKYIYDSEELREIARTVRTIEESENINELSRALKIPLLDFKRNPKDEGNLAAMNAAKRKAQELGADPKELIEKAVENIVNDLPDLTDREDLAASIIRSIFKPAEKEVAGQIENKPVSGTKPKPTTTVLEPSTVTKEWVSKLEKAGKKYDPLNSFVDFVYSKGITLSDFDKLGKKEQGIIESEFKNQSTEPSTVKGEEVKPIENEKAEAAKVGIPVNTDKIRKSNANSIEFKKPIIGKNGAKLLSYTWESNEVGKGKDGKPIRISDWAKAGVNADTGRRIIHKFKVEIDGKVVEVSADSVAKALGFTDAEMEKAFPNAKDFVKQLAKLKIKEQGLLNLLDEGREAIDKAVKKVSDRFGVDIEVREGGANVNPAYMGMPKEGVQIGDIDAAALVREELRKTETTLTDIVKVGDELFKTRRAIENKIKQSSQLGGMDFSEEKPSTAPKLESKPNEKTETKIPDTKEGTSSANEPTNKVSEQTEKAEPKKDIGTKARTLTEKQQDFNKKVDEKAAKLKDKLIPQHLRGIKKQGLGIEEVIDGGSAFVKKAYEIGTNMKEAVDKAVKYIRDNWDKSWGDFDEQTVRDHFQEFQERSGIVHSFLYEGSSEKRQSGLSRHMATATNVSQLVRDYFSQKEYREAKHKEAEVIAKAMVKELGVNDALVVARGVDMHPSVRSAIYAESINHFAKLEQEAHAKGDAQAELDAAKMWKDISDEYDKQLTGSGQFTSYAAHFYKKSPLGIILKENQIKADQFNEFAKNKDQSWKEFFDELIKEPEFEKEVQVKVQEELKKERAEARKARIAKVDKMFDDAINKLKSGGAAYSTFVPIPPKVLAGALEGMKKAYHAGEKVAKIIEDAVDYINKEVGSGWNKDAFTKDWEGRLSEQEAKTITELPADKREKILERLRKKLKGLSEKEKEEVIRRAFEQAVENGALDYKDLRKIIGDVLGYGDMTDAEAAHLFSLVEDINKVGELGEKIRETDRSEKGLQEYMAAKKKAEKSATELGKIVYNKPNIRKRLLSILQLNTLTFSSLINNPVFNIMNQTQVRGPRSLVMSAIDYAIYGTGKLFGKDYLPTNNPFVGQAEFWRKLGQGTKESMQQFRSGLTNKDYFQKEIYASQIHPATSWAELWDFGRGKTKLTKEQVADKLIQGTIGINAEFNARMLNMGDKPQRYAAEGGQAAVFSNNLGLKGIDRKLFMAFPKEEAYRKFKEQGLSDDAAMKNAEDIEKRLIKEGEESVFQEDNLLNDAINGAFEAMKKGGQYSYGFGQIIKTLNMPFVKIPLNAFWSTFNLVNPEVALLQSVTYAVKAMKTKSPLDVQQSKKWFAHAVVGMGWMAVTGALVKAGIVNPDNSDDTTKKEREGELYYEQPNSINLGKLLAFVQGKDHTKVKDGFTVDLKWLGAIGIVMGYQAKRLQDMTPEQKENGQEYIDGLASRLNTSALDFMDKGVFSNTGKMVHSILKGGAYGDSYVLNLVNMGTNILHPATMAQWSRSQMPYYSKVKAETFAEEVKNSMLNRSSRLRAFMNQMPPAKIGIWGDRLDKKGNTLLRMFGMSKANDDNFAQPIYEDYKRTNNTRFFPSSIKPTIKVDDKNVKLTPKEALELEVLVGQQRKQLVAPFINDMAMFQGSENKYSSMTDEQKTYNLNILYDVGYEAGLHQFKLAHSQYKDAKPTVEQQIKEAKEEAAHKQIRSKAKAKMQLHP